MINRKRWSTISQYSYNTFQNTHWWYLYWRMILNSFSPLFHWWQPSTTSSKIASCSAPLSGLHNFHTWNCSCEHSPGCTRTHLHTWDCSFEQSPGCTRTCVHTRDSSCEHSPGCTRTFGCGGCLHQCNKVDFPYLLSLCALFMTSFHSFSIVAFASGINIAWSERSFVCASRFPEACVSKRQISRVFWTIRNNWFAKFADQNHIRSLYFFFPSSHLRVSRTPRIFQGYLKNFVSQIRCAARRENMCLLSPSKGIKWRASLRSFHRDEFVRKVVIKYRIPFLPCNINTSELFLPQMSWLFQSSSCEIRSDSSFDS